MNLKKIVFFVIISFICFNHSLLANEVKNQVLYNKAQKIIDGYSGNKSLLKKARKYFDKIASTNPNSKYALVGYGRLAYKQNNNNEQAKTYFNKAITADSNFLDAYFYGAYPYFFSKDYDNAKKMVTKANTLAPESIKVDLLNGELAKQEKNYELVIKHANSAIQKNPNAKIKGDAYRLLTFAYKGQKKYDLAKNAYKKIIETDPNNAWSKINYSSFLMNYMKNYDKAIEQGKSALKIMNFGMGHKVLGEAYYEKAAELHWKKKQYQESIEYFLLATKHYPTYANAHYGLGMSYYQVGHKNKNKSQIIQAKESLTKAIELDPGHKQAIKYLENLKKLLKVI